MNQIERHKAWKTAFNAFSAASNNYLNYIARDVTSPEGIALYRANVEQSRTVLNAIAMMQVTTK